MNLLSVENLSKNYGEKILFKNINFGIEKGQKVALIAPNGTGKTSLLRVLAGEDLHYEGIFSFRKDAKIIFLNQEPNFGNAQTIGEAVLNAQNPAVLALKFYESSLISGNNEDITQALQDMDNTKAWEYDQKINEILTKLKIGDLTRDIKTLSGGQRKRIALAQVLLAEPDFYILDEPTNHLDLDMIEWLEEYLSRQNITLLMVTHDRYFLEYICSDILEMDKGEIYRYKGNYAHFLEKKEEREHAQSQEVGKARNLMRKELDWIRRQPKARGTKAKYRIDAFQELKNTAEKNLSKDNVALSVQMSRLGNKILEVEKISKKYGDLTILDKFSYVFKKGEKIGIVGNNGVGKSTLLNILTEKYTPDSGEISKGETVVFGYYTQDGLQIKEDKRVIDLITEIAEQITIGKNMTLSPMQLLERFLFPPKQQYAYISTLSGGEKRRLYLLTILARNPNFLVLDEPTNDLDIITLQILEEFLTEFGGCSLIVTHDRYFMDKIVDHIWVLEGNGQIKDYNGSYSEYRAVLEYERELALEAEKEQEKINKMQEKSQQKNQENNKPETQKQENASNIATQKRKISFKEQREYETLEKEIEALENQKAQLNHEISTGELPFDKLNQKLASLSKISQDLDEKSLRWLELAEMMA